MELSRIRNFCIIAHIDHGKSTLADRILEITGAITKRESREQHLDGMDLERERGITIKAKAVALSYTYKGTEYLLNLIDTPGHVDFNYEVSRSLAACEGAVLLVDATQGVQAQTVANSLLAINGGLEIIPVLNKIDLATAHPDECVEEIENVLGLDGTDALRISGKTGENVPALLERIVEIVPPPKGNADPKAPLRALVIDSAYDDYKGVVVYIRMIDGALRARENIQLMSSHKVYEVLEVGVFTPTSKPVEVLAAGEVGYFWGAIKSLEDVHIGDTITHDKSSGLISTEPLPGYAEPIPMVYAGIFPTFNAELPQLRKALEKLHLNDASFVFEPEKSEALGFGFRCGFLGLLHMEIVQERLERESNVQIVQTAPSVPYEVLKKDKSVVVIHTPAQLPDLNYVEEIREPIVRASIMCPTEFIGTVMKLCEDKRSKYLKQDHIGMNRVMLHYDIPLAEIIFDFFDILKGSTKGYGTLDYTLMGFAPSDLVKLNILVNAVPVDALSMICHRDQAELRGRELCKKLKKEIPKHLFEVPIQAAIGGRIVARETVTAIRKDVTAKCYGGDITRKRKLLEKQKEGKKRMKHVGNVEIPQEAFLSVLNSGKETDEEKGKKRKS